MLVAGWFLHEGVCVCVCGCLSSVGVLMCVSVCLCVCAHCMLVFAYSMFGTADYSLSCIAANQLTPASRLAKIAFRQQA